MTDRPIESASIDEVRARRKDLRQRMIDLEAAAARPAGRDPELWWKSVRAELDELLEAWDHHVATTERPDGFLDEVIAHAPQLARRRLDLERDHVEIGGMLDAVLAADAGGTSPSVESARDDVVALLGALVRHRHKGVEFTYDAYNVDLTEGD